MARIPGIRPYLRSSRGSASIRRAVDDELAFHFEMRIAELMSHGLSHDQARLEAERTFGDVDRVRERLTRLDRERLGQARRADWWDALRQDTAYAARGLRRSPGFTLGVVATLALGIGANSAVFTVVDRLLLRPPPHIDDAANLRRVHVEMTFANGETNTRAPMSYPEFVALRDGARSFDMIAGFNYPQPVALGRGIDAPRVKRMRVTADYFRTLGVRPALGRFFVAEDDDPSVGTPAAVISHGFWQRRFAESDVVGESVVLDGRHFLIIGVAPKGFSGADLDAADVWVPLAPVAAAEAGPRWDRRAMSFGLHVVAHLRPGVTDARAGAEATAAVRPAHAGTFLAQRPARVRLGSVIPGRRLDGRNTEATVATRLAGAAALVLLIACANVANLLLARGLSRRRELAVRLALGVGRGRLVGQLLTESLLLSLLAGSAALAMAMWGGSLLRAFLLPDVSWAEPPVDLRALAFTGGIALAVGIAAGLAPAVQMTGPDLAASLKAGWRDRGRNRSITRSGLLLAQATFSVVLLVGAGLFVRSLRNARSVDVGFALDRTILVEVGLAGPAPTPAENERIHRELAARARSAPGVSRASLTAALPFWTFTVRDFFLPGRDSLPPGLGTPWINAIDPDAIATMGIRLSAGRGLTPGDGEGAERVALVNETMARRLWPGESALGKCFMVEERTAPCTTVVGVVRDVQFQNIREPGMMQYYVPLSQNPARREILFVIVRVDDARDVGDVAAAVRSAIRGSRPDLESLTVRPMLELVDPQLRPFRLGATIFGTFGLIALVLAGVGLYAVISFGVARRTRELGIRAALGARGADVVRLVVSEGVRVALAGVALGIGLAIALGRVVEAMLFDISPRDPLVFAVVAVTLLVVALIATLVPGWRAARVDPIEALRAE